MWTIQLLGGLSVNSPQRQVTRFRTQKAASLLAYLASHPAPQPRETLLDLLWPDAEPDVARHNLSNALSFLRHQLEPPGVPPGTVVLADRASVRLNPAAVTVDVVEFENDLRQANAEGLSDAERMARLQRAVERYGGGLLPGYYEEWVAPEVLRLESVFVQAVCQLVPLLLQAGRREQALAYAQRAVSADPLSEEATLCLMHALSASGQSGPALRAYRALAQRLQEEMDAQPSRALQSLAGQLGQSGSSRIASAVPEHAGSTGEVFALAPERPDLPAPQEPALHTAVVRTASPARLLGGEFRLRTTTRFFGREEEIERLSRMLSAPRTRLVTLTGPGGTGKTRLALEAAAQIVELAGDAPTGNAPTGAVFVPLAPVTEPRRLFDVTLRSLGIVPVSNQDPLDQLAEALEAHPHTLLVLDNFEQLVEEGALRVHDLLTQAASVRLLVTSRQRLHIEGEREFHLAPLPTSGRMQTVEDLLGVPSIALFVDRAQSALPDFQLTERNAAVVAQLCDRLEGLPLAIELAAARVGILTPARILEQVRADRLDFLTTRRRDAESRQRTLRATLDWSYQLLPEAGQQFLAQVSVFRGGWTLEAAQAVCRASEEETLELLMLLRDSSLIGVIDSEEGLRFTLLETIREYASEQLDQMGDLETLTRRHQEFFLTMAQSAEGELSGSEQGVWLDRLELEHENLRSALTWSLKFSEERRGAGKGKGTEDGSHLTASVPLLFCAALRVFWSTRGHLREGWALCRAALQAEGAQARTAARGKALNAAGELARLQGDCESSRACHAESLAIFREIGDRNGIGLSLCYLGIVAYFLGDYPAAQAYHEENLATFREIGDRRGIASALTNLGNVAYYVGDYAAAQAYHEESLATFREIGDRRGVASALNNLGMAARDQGDYAAAQAYHEESLATYREIGHRHGIALAFNNLGRVFHSQGEDDAAKALLEESLTIRQELGDRWGITSSLSNLGMVAHDRGDYGVARTLFEESLAIKQELGDKRDIATLLECFASLAASEGQPERAARLWGAGEALREELGSPIPPSERGRYDSCVALVREALDETVFVTAWEQGQGMTLDETIRYALEEGAAAV